ncbi:hypothetical protein DFH08DRAFT_173050 [Mycena albidolilacea]|uniref:Uncharacterized protein n=1 Tax=Mycena albidolilacea TaxID=1033008 RepID=A0AAD7ARY7_9AGAR|nr:hypothetical protein DFH08DRAFT_173050 [Mycena albidolilacea]
MLTAVRAASPHCRLTLNAEHRLHDGKSAKTRFPDDVDVVLASPLVFTLSGVLNGVKLASDEVLQSQLAQHLVDYFQANAAELGIASVSSMYLGDDGLPKLKIVSSRCLTPESELRRVHVTLVGIDLNYAWHTKSESTSNSLVHPFSTHLSLPFKMLLDNVICRFFTWHLVRRYPLIFGPWCQQLDIERPYFNKIFRSISGIIARSPNASFRKKCTRMLQIMQEQHTTNFTAAAASLATYFGSSDGMEEDSTLDDDEAFSLSMEIRYRTCLRRPQFKGTTRPSQADGSDDEELSQNLSLLTPESSQRFDETYLWPIPPAPSDFAFESDDLPPSANIEHLSILDMGIEKENQDPVELWSDLDDDGDDNLLLSLSSSDEAGPAFLGHEAHSQQHLDMDLPSVDFFLIGRHRRSHDELGLDLDVNMDRVLNASHAFGSPDAPASQTSPSRIQSLSPPAASGWSALREGPTEGYFPGLSSMQGQADLDFELSFDSDVDESNSDAHHLEEFEDVLRGTAHLTEEGLEHQASNAGIGTDIGAGMDGVDEDEDFGIAYW